MYADMPLTTGSKPTITKLTNFLMASVDFEDLTSLSKHSMLIIIQDTDSARPQIKKMIQASWKVS